MSTSNNLGDLVIGLRADLATLQSDMSAGKQIVSSAMSDITAAADAAKRALGLIGVGIGVDAFKDMVAGAIEFKARLLDVETQTGISVTALGALANVGKLTHTALDDIATSSAKLSKAIATQNEDSKGAAQAIGAIGLNFNTFKQLDPEGQMMAVAKAMDEFEDGTGKTAAAMLLFGKNGSTLLPFLRELAEQTQLTSVQNEEASRQAKAFEDGLAKLKIAGDTWLDQTITPMLPALAKLVEQMVQATTWTGKLAVAWANIKGNVVWDEQTLAVAKLNGEITAASRQFEFFDSLNKTVGGDLFFQRQADDARAKLEALQKAALGASDALKGSADATDRDALLGRPVDFGSGSGWDKKKKVPLSALGPKQTGADPYDAAIASITKLSSQMSDAADKGSKLTEVQKLQASIYSELDGKLDSLSVDQKVYIDTLLQAALAEEKVALERQESVKENDATLAAAAKRVDATYEENKALDDQVKQLGLNSQQIKTLELQREADTIAQLKGLAATMDTVGATGQLRDTYVQLATTLEKNLADKKAIADFDANQANNPNAGALKAVQDYVTNVQRAGDATRNAVQSSMTGLENATVSILTGGNAKNAIKQWVDGMISELVRLQIVKPLLADVFSGISGSGGGSAGLLSSIIGAFGGFGSANASGSGSFASLAGISGGRAAGGGVDAGKTYLVGEKGPELLRMGNGAGTVIPNGAQSGANFSYSPVIHIDARSDQAAVAAQTAAAVRKGNADMMALLKARGAI